MIPVTTETDRIECTISELEGLSFPGDPELPPRLQCEIDLDDTNHGLQHNAYDLVGDTESFFHGQDLSYGDVRISVPVEYVREKHRDIYFDMETYGNITITSTGEDHEDRRRKLLSKTRGKVFVLVIRISDSGTGRRAVRQNRSQLSNK